MSLHNARSRRFSRGASLPEYALLLFLMTGGTAAALKATGIDIRSTFESSSAVLGGDASNGQSSGSTTLPGVDPPRRDGGSR